MDYWRNYDWGDAWEFFIRNPGQLDCPRYQNKLNLLIRIELGKMLKYCEFLKWVESVDTGFAEDERLNTMLEPLDVEQRWALETDSDLYYYWVLNVNEETKIKKERDGNANPNEEGDRST